MATYERRNAQMISLLRVVFISFIFVLVVIAFALAYVDWPIDDVGDPLLLWHLCLDFLVAIYVAAPAYKLISLVSFPHVINRADAHCVNFSKFGVPIFSLLFCARGIYHLLQFSDVRDLLETTHTNPNGPPLLWRRIFSFIYVFIFEVLTSCLALYGVDLLHKHKEVLDREGFGRPMLASQDRSDKVIYRRYTMGGGFD
jgi:hypothetical protein